MIIGDINVTLNSNERRLGCDNRVSKGWGGGGREVGRRLERGGGEERGTDSNDFPSIFDHLINSFTLYFFSFYFSDVHCL